MPKLERLPWTAVENALGHPAIRKSCGDTVSMIFRRKRDLRHGVANETAKSVY